MSIARLARQLVLPFLFAAPAVYAQPVAPGSLLGSTGNQGNSLISIDPGTGGGTPRCALGSLGPVTEIEYRADGALFGATGQGSANIIQINPDGCAETLVGHHDPGAVNGLEFVGNVLYGAFFSTGGGEGIPPTYLVTVNQTTGALAILGAMGYSPVRGLAWDAGTGTMYGVGSTTTLPPDGVSGSDELFTVDLATGATTPIGPTGIPLGGIELGPDGVLYGGASSAPGEGGGGAPLVAVSRTTGLATPIGSGTGAPALSGLAFAPAGPAPSVLEIPTVSEVGLALLTALLGGAAVALLRRR
ncbi:MAG: IPTL-CTERM sorting domain-containing protein [Holophagales bacterium]|nr:MAG: IPTL-CTERM sorting domain-containing protein [Holophagales bacterium]